ncbi:MAG TPA: 3-oxoacyl-ACP reductase [Planctomycetaceae bacterium]|nr:3-oxoacyl-ACP reductase [Planctomycetaceae bacterium]
MSFASLNGRRILITGASSGIGREIAMECFRAGASVILNCRRSVQQARQVASEIIRQGGSAEVLAADVSSPQDRERLVQQVCAGGIPDALVNSAGADTLTTELRQATFSEKLTALLRTDVEGTIELSRTLGVRMREAGRGVILTIGWDQSDRGMEGDSGELFAAAKNAVMGFSRSLALSLAPAVRVNCIAPGWIRTAWGETASDYWQQRVLRETPLQRWGEPRDIACMARFLLSDEAGWITGQVLNVNGGAVR